MIKFSYQQKLGNFKLNVESQFPSKGVTVLFGESGSGKSSLLRLICGFEKSEHASLQIDGKEYEHHIKTWQRKIGYVSQTDSLFPHLSVEYNLQYAMSRSTNNTNNWDRGDLVDQFKIKSLLHKQPSELSGGEVQRVVIVRALLSQPRILILDEPLSAVDEKSRFELLKILRATIKSHASLLYVTHDRREVAMIADHMMIMSQGKIISSDPYLKIASDISHSYSHDTHIISNLEVEFLEIIEDNLIKTTLGNEIVFLREQDKNQNNKTFNNEASIRVQVPASEVSIDLQKNNQSSILNQIAVTVSDLSIEKDGQQLILLAIAETNQKIIASITTHSVKILKLQTGLQCFACFKAVALNF